MTAQPKRTWTVEEYLDFERRSETKHEYFGGEIFAMAGVSAAHNIITANIVAILHRQVFQRNCTVFPSDMRLKVERHHLYTYPDITVVCGEVHYEDTAQDNLLNPTIIIEVLSPSTENHDRGKKSQYHQRHPDAVEIVQRTARLALSRTVLGELLAGFAIGSREAKSRSLNHTCRSIAAEHAAGSDSAMRRGPEIAPLLRADFQSIVFSIYRYGADQRRSVGQE